MQTAEEGLVEMNQNEVQCGQWGTEDVARVYLKGVFYSWRGDTMASCDGTIVAEQMNQWRHPGWAGGRGACGRGGGGSRGRWTHLATSLPPQHPPAPAAPQLQRSRIFPILLRRSADNPRLFS